MPTKSRLGQNFLRDAGAVDRIAAALGECATRTVVEIGPGRGAITHRLAQRARHVLAVEFDETLAEELRATTSPDRVTVVARDVLTFNFHAAAQSAGEKLLVAGNLPYYITSPILLLLAAQHASLDRAVLMVQREVAERVTAAPGTREYGLLSVTVQMYGPVEQLFTLEPSCFVPPPEVHSTVFRWIFRPRFAELGVDESGFLRFARQAFAQKRKTLANNLRAAGMASDRIAESLAAAGIAPQARAETLSLSQFSTLYQAAHMQKAAPEDGNGL